MQTSEILSRYDRYQRIELEEPEARREVTPHVVRLLRPAPRYNMIRYSWLDENNADAMIAGEVEHFAGSGQGLEWWLMEHDQPADLAERLAAHGFTLADEPGSLMALELASAPAELLAAPRADVRPVGLEQLDEVIAVEEQVWGRDFSWLRTRLAEHLAIPGYLSMYAAYVGNRPACAGWLYFYGDNPFAELFGGSTLPVYRGQGLYTAVLAARVQEAARRGCQFLTIDASEMSRPIVARHGFRLLAHTFDFERNP